MALDLFALQTQISVNVQNALNSLNRLGTEASNVASQLDARLGNNRVDINTNGATSNLEDLENQADETSDALEDVEDSADDGGKGLQDFSGVADAVTGVVLGLGAGIAALTGGFLALASSTREYREDMAKLDTAFQNAGHTSEEATKTYKDLFAVFGEEDRAVEAAQQIAKLADNQKEMEEMTRIATGAWAMWGDSLATESLMEAVNSTAKIGQVQGTLADALEWCGVNLDDFNEKLAGLKTEEERSALIRQTLTGLYGEAADQYKETNAVVMEANTAQSNLTDKMAQLGEKAEPILSKIKEGFAMILDKIFELLEDVDFEAIAQSIETAFKDFTENTLPKIISALQWIIDNKDLIIAGIVGIGAAFVAWKVVGIVQAVIGALKGMTLAQAALNLVMAMNPIGLVVAAIAGLVAAFVVLWNKSEKFRDFFKGMWEGIKDAVGKAVDWIKDSFKSMSDSVKGFFNGMIGSINGAIKAINKIKINIPDWVPGEYGGKSIGFNLKTIPLLAKGGFVDNPTMAMIGEAGDEVVLPLERNTSWMDKLADKVNENRNSSSDINRLIGRIDALEQSILSMNIYIDKEALIGNISKDIDNSLGNIASARERGR
jgi:hypothetical protein